MLWGGLTGRNSCRFVLGGYPVGTRGLGEWEHSALGSEWPPSPGCEDFSSCSASHRWWWGQFAGQAPNLHNGPRHRCRVLFSLQKESSTLPGHGSLFQPGRHVSTLETGGQKLPEPSTERVRGCICLGINGNPYLCFPKRTTSMF